MAAAYVQSMWKEHRTFVALSALGFAALYAELAWFAHALWRARGDGEAGALIAAVFVITLAAYLASFAPARSFTVEGVERQGSLVLPELIAQLSKGAALIVLASMVDLALCLYLVAFNLDASYTLLNNIYVFTLAGAGLLHVLATYVRYGALLYAVKQDSWVKVLSVSAGLGLLILGAFLVLIALDIGWQSTLPAAERGLVGLHVYGRDLYFFSLALGLYGWHVRWMAQH
jgi:hypothetical protein